MDALRSSFDSTVFICGGGFAEVIRFQLGSEKVPICCFLKSAIPEKGRISDCVDECFKVRSGRVSILFQQGNLVAGGWMLDGLLSLSVKALPDYRLFPEQDSLLMSCGGEELILEVGWAINL